MRILNIEWVEIPGGTFDMGSPSNEPERKDDETKHLVRLSAFEISKYAITFEQYDAFCDERGFKKPHDEGWGRGKRPVINVSWDDANNFAEMNGCRLPTEAEWEYACRAGTNTPFNTGNNLTTAQANYDGNYPYNNNSKGGWEGKTLPVGSFSPNGWGLYDMHGNVWEWCSDDWDGDDWDGDYHTSAHPEPDEGLAFFSEIDDQYDSGPYSGSRRVCRGGSWEDHASDCRSAYRNRSYQDERMYNTGFRLVYVDPLLDFYRIAENRYQT